MRSIARVKGGKSPRADGSTTSGPTEIFWGKPMPGTANGRGPGKGGRIMISLRLALGAAGGSPFTEPSVPARDPRHPWDRSELF